MAKKKETLRDKMVGKESRERASLKGAEIASCIKLKKLKAGKRFKLDKKTGLWK